MTPLLTATPALAAPLWTPTLAINPYLQGLLIVIFLCVSLLLVLVVLIQRPQGGGLSGAFGSSSGSGQTAFGTKTGDALTIATIILFTIFVLGAIVLNFTTRPAGPAPAPTAGADPIGETTGVSPAGTPGNTGTTGTSPGSPPSQPVQPIPEGQAPAPAPSSPQTNPPAPSQPLEGTTPPAPAPGSNPAPENPKR